MTAEQLKQIATHATQANIATYAPILNRYMHKYNICGKLREAAFMATIIHESGSFKYVREIASGSAYEGRRDLGNVHKGDGVRFRGRGLLQITGRANYKQVSDALGVDFIANPELLEQPEYAAESACWWWSNRGLNRLADAGKFKEITRAVNGGYNGLADREKWYKKALEVL
jgi:putative chitinase